VRTAAESALLALAWVVGRVWSMADGATGWVLEEHRDEDGG